MVIVDNTDQIYPQTPMSCDMSIYGFRELVITYQHYKYQNNVITFFSVKNGCDYSNRTLNPDLLTWVVCLEHIQTCALSKHIGNMCMRLRNGGKRRGFGEPFPAFRAEYTYLPICFDSAHVLYLSCNFKS